MPAALWPRVSDEQNREWASCLEPATECQAECEAYTDYRCDMRHLFPVSSCDETERRQRHCKLECLDTLKSCRARVEDGVTEWVSGAAEGGVSEPQAESCRDQYEHFPNQATQGENIDIFFVETGPEACMSACSRNENCRSFDYNPKFKQCFLSDKNRHSDPPPVMLGRPQGNDDWPYDYYEKCRGR
jgi:hypothetical protein